MTTATFTDKCKDTFNIEERKFIQENAGQMFKENTIQHYLTIGKKQVCMERENAKEKTIRIFLMNETLEMNDEIVTRFNKRKKAG